ncbi:MAG TPA: hypothetical protein PKA55_12110 [Rhodoblastus sp.]|nr:hypothetical protein [Rhodoblastus sp.]
MTTGFISSRADRRATKLTTLLAAGACLCAAPTATFAQSFGSATLSAYILSTGAISRSSGVASVTKPSTGAYTITFTRELSACYFAVSAVGSNAAFGTGNVSTSNPKILFVRTFSGAGAAINIPFNVIVVCGP